MLFDLIFSDVLLLQSVKRIGSLRVQIEMSVQNTMLTTYKPLISRVNSVAKVMTAMRRLFQRSCIQNKIKTSDNGNVCYM